ncbi:hypothetical protein O982_24595 [Mycobacterium avium 10-5581]|nr:hypothetical protein O982_24595 [Mycobacterium avium 10-5581]
MTFPFGSFAIVSRGADMLGGLAFDTPNITM